MLPYQLNALGRRAKDRILGVEGVITSINFDLYGCCQATLDLTNKDGEPVTWPADFARLEVIGEPRMAQPNFSNDGKLPAQLSKLGLVAKDLITGRTGCFSSVEFMTSGVVFATITPEGEGDKKSSYLDFHRLQFTDERKMAAPEWAAEYEPGPDVSQKPRGYAGEERERI